MLPAPATASIILTASSRDHASLHRHALFAVAPAAARLAHPPPQIAGGFRDPAQGVEPGRRAPPRPQMGGGCRNPAQVVEQAGEALAAREPAVERGERVRVVVIVIDPG